MNYLLGIDIGTQGTKTTLFTENREVIAESRKASNLLNPTENAVEENPDDIFSSVIDTIKHTIEQSGVFPGDVAAIGIDGQMAGILGIDNDFEAVAPWDSWLDVRCGKYIDVLKSSEEEINRISGGPVTFDHAPKMIWWMNEHPEIYKRIKKFVLPHVYVSGKLAGITSDRFYS